MLSTQDLSHETVQKAQLQTSTWNARHPLLDIMSYVNQGDMTLTRSSVWRMNLFTCLGDAVCLLLNQRGGKKGYKRWPHADEPTCESMINHNLVLVGLTRNRRLHCLATSCWRTEVVAPWQAEHFVVVFWIFVELQLATGASCAVVLELLSL